MNLTRANIQIDSVLGDSRNAADGSWNFALAEDPRIGYVRLTNFGEHTEDELGRALKWINEHCQALILDLRDDPGGLLPTAEAVCDMFLDKGLIVSTKGRDGVVRRSCQATPGTLFDPEKPMVVLVNHHSASASEIVAACLQDHKRATIVGQRTWGKGTVQNLIEMEGGRSMLKLTVASYWRPSGKNIHRDKEAKDTDEWGVRPDDGFEVVLTDEQNRQLFRQRAERDIVPGKGVTIPVAAPSPKPAAPIHLPEVNLSPSDPLEPGKTPAPPAEAGPIDDLQLRKAIEFLQGELDATRVG